MQGNRSGILDAGFQNVAKELERRPLSSLIKEIRLSGPQLMKTYYFSSHRFYRHYQCVRLCADDVPKFDHELEFDTNAEEEKGRAWWMLNLVRIYPAISCSLPSKRLGLER